MFMKNNYVSIRYHSFYFYLHLPEHQGNEEEGEENGRCPYAETGIRKAVDNTNHRSHSTYTNGKEWHDDIFAIELAFQTFPTVAERLIKLEVVHTLQEILAYDYDETEDANQHTDASKREENAEIGVYQLAELCHTLSRGHHSHSVFVQCLGKHLRHLFPFVFFCFHEEKGCSSVFRPYLQKTLSIHQGISLEDARRQ